MSEDSPEVHQILKDDDEDEDSARSEVSDEADDHYPEDIADETPDTGEDTDNDEGPETDVMDAKSEDEEAEEKTLTEKLSLHHKCGTKKEFTQLGKRDTVLFDTPVEGLKTGKITDREESWSGILQVEVDTGAKSYTLTPFQDDYSAEYGATVDSKLELSQEGLNTLEAAGESVVLDVPKMGPTRTTVTDVVESENQGLRGTFKAADGLHFVVYEEPSGVQTKEQAYIIGRERQ